MIKQLVLLILAISTTQCINWQVLYHFFDQSQNPATWEVPGWVLADTDSIKTSCGSDPIIGSNGGLTLDDVFLASIDLSALPHDLLRIQFDLYAIDSESWLLDVQSLFALILEAAALDYDITVSPQLLCGDPYGIDAILSFDIIFEHSDDDLNFDFLASLNSFLSDKYWGINDVIISVQPDCPVGQYYFQYECVDQADLQQCFDQLGKLDASPVGNTSISNSCDWEEVDNEFVYTFDIVYLAPYSHDPECVSQTINFNGSDLPEGDWSNFGEWQYDGTNTINFKVKHSDLVSTYGCTYSEETTKFRWTCQVSLTIWFDGYEQLTYEFTAKYDLPKDTSAETVITVTQNFVQGDCCENELEIETELRICADPDCNDYEDSDIANPFEIERQSPVTVEHSIVTQQFQYLYLNVQSISIGPFWPFVTNYVGDQPGRSIITFIPSVAMDSLTISVISKLQESESIEVGPLRRALQTNFSEDEYLVKGQKTVNVKDPEDMARNNQQQQEFGASYQQKLIEEEEETQKLYNNLIIIVSIFGSLLFLSFISIGANCKVKGSQQKQVKKYVDSVPVTEHQRRASETETINVV